MNSFVIEPCVVGMIGTNCYIVYRKNGERKEGEYFPGVVIDPGDNAPYILNSCRELGVKPEAILLTHVHFDPILAVEDVRRSLGQCMLSCPGREGAFQRRYLVLSICGQDGSAYGKPGGTGGIGNRSFVFPFRRHEGIPRTWRRNVHWI